MAEVKKLHVIISKVDGPVFKGEVSSVTVPGSDGEMTLLANHSALISPLKAGKITVRTESENKEFDIEQGTLEISSNQVTILI